MNPVHSRFANLAIAEQASVSRVFTASDLETWRTLAGAPDLGGVPEPLIAGLFSYLLGEELPGHGTNYLKQTMQFEDQARIDELLTARVIVNRLRPEKALVNLETICTGEGGRLICRGEALVLFQH